MNHAKLLRILLRVTGTLELFAFAAVVMPRAWMAHGHELLGLGEFPTRGVTDFMIRQASYTYGMHGIVLWLMSLDVRRYRPLLILTGISYTLAGPVFAAIDVVSGLPHWWAVLDAGGCFGFGVATLFLLSRMEGQPAGGEMGRSGGAENLQ